MPTSPLPAPNATPSETVADRLALRVATRDAPPPPLSHEPAAVLARVAAYLETGLGQRSPRARQRLARMLLLLIDHPEVTSAQLQAAAGLGARATSRMAHRLLQTHFIDRERRGPLYYHRLTRQGEDALLLVVAGPPVQTA